MSPIRPENRDKYPADWPEIRERILVRSRMPFSEIERCECMGECGKAHQSLRGRCPEVNGDPPRHFGGEKVILTVAHLDHDVSQGNHDDSNLKALCQSCHLRYDSEARAAGVRARREQEQAKGTASLFVVGGRT